MCLAGLQVQLGLDDRPVITMWPADTVAACGMHCVCISLHASLLSASLAVSACRQVCAQNHTDVAKQPSCGRQHKQQQS